MLPAPRPFRDVIIRGDFPLLLCRPPPPGHLRRGGWRICDQRRRIRARPGKRIAENMAHLGQFPHTNFGGWCAKYFSHYWSGSRRKWSTRLKRWTELDKGDRSRCVAARSQMRGRSFCCYVARGSPKPLCRK